MDTLFTVFSENCLNKNQGSTFIDKIGMNLEIIFIVQIWNLPNE